MLRARRIRGRFQAPASPAFIGSQVTSLELEPAFSLRRSLFTNHNRSIAEMTGLILLGGPLFVVLGCLYWVLSLSKKQAEVNAEVWARHGVKV